MDRKASEALWLWKLVFTIKTAIGIAITVMLVYLATMPALIKPIYESETILYIPLTNLNQQISQQGIGFANEHEVDLYIQILRSTVLADSMKKRLGITSNSFYESLESNLKVEKTRYSSVSVKVRDTSPEKAAYMANLTVKLAESIKNALLYPNRKEAMLYNKSLYEQKILEVAGLKRKIDSLALHTGNPLKDLDYEGAVTEYKLELQELIGRKNQYEHAMKDFDTPLPNIYVISAATAATKPSFPRRGLLCITAAFVYLCMYVTIEVIKRDLRKNIP